MHTLNLGKICFVAAIAAAIALGWVCPTSVIAQNGTWIESTGDGLWSAPGSWQGGTIADGAGNTANFSMVDVSAQAVLTNFPGTGFSRNAVQLDSARTVGNLVFGDSDPSSPGAIELYSLLPTTGPQILTLAGGSPTITVNPLGPIDTATLGDPSPEFLDDALIGATVALNGTAGFTKTGSGILTLAGASNHTATNVGLQGQINVTQGTLRILGTATFDIETVLSPAQTTFHVGSGATLDTRAGIRNITVDSGATILTNNTGTIAIGVAGATSGITIPTNGNLTLNHAGTGVAAFGGVSGTGATVTLNASNGGTRLEQNWAINGSPAVVNLNGTRADLAQSFIDLRFSGGGFTQASLRNSTVNLNNVLINTNVGSTGASIDIGALNGAANSTLRGGTNGHAHTNYFLGTLNTDAVFAGTITNNPIQGGTAGQGFFTRGVNIIKQGTGIQELSGPLTYQPGNTTQPERRGGITRIEAGTLKLTGTASLPAGIANGQTGDVVPVALGDLWTTVDVRQGATLDVSATTGTYSSSALQQTIGRGTIVGNYNHDEGVLAPGDTNGNGFVAALTGAGGTLTFADTLSFAGAGQINFDISPSLASGNDLLQVGGANLAGNPVVKVGFLGGATAGQYTVLNSNTPLVGTVAGWSVLWEGRGAAPALVQTANQVRLDLSSIQTGNVNWAGTVDGAWNAGAAGTQNWRNVTGGNPGVADKFFQLDNVAFRDTSDGTNAPTTTSVTLNTNVFPTSVLVDSSLNYTIAGTGRITGNTSLTKQGSGTLTITTNNDYSGGTTIAGGILNRDATGGLGTGTLTLSGGELQSRAGTIVAPVAVTAATTNRVRTLGSVVAMEPLQSGIANLNFDGSISGSGNLEFHNDSMVMDPVALVLVPQIQAVDIRANNTGFTGTISFRGAGQIAARWTVVGAEGTNVAYDLGNSGSSLGLVNPSATPVPVKLGSLTGGPNASLNGHASGGGNIAGVFYEIGSLGTSTSFSGTINDGNKTGDPARLANITHLKKVGAGTLTLDGLNTYTGDTRVDGGTLSISNAYLADIADVYIGDGAILNLNHSLEDTIDSLFLDGVPMATGTWGATGSGATNINNTFFSGLGRLLVQSVGVLPGLIGDYNGDMKVDAADYTVWRNNVGGDGALLGSGRDPNNMGVIGPADYNSWKANFGNSSPGAGSLSNVAGVPEPSTAVLWIVALVSGWSALPGVSRSRTVLATASWGARRGCTSGAVQGLS